MAEHTLPTIDNDAQQLSSSLRIPSIANLLSLDPAPTRVTRSSSRQAANPNNRSDCPLGLLPTIANLIHADPDSTVSTPVPAVATSPASFTPSIANLLTTSPADTALGSGISLSKTRVTPRKRKASSTHDQNSTLTIDSPHPVLRRAKRQRAAGVPLPTPLPQAPSPPPHSAQDYGPGSTSIKQTRSGRLIMSNSDLPASSKMTDAQLPTPSHRFGRKKKDRVAAVNPVTSSDSPDARRNTSKPGIDSDIIMTGTEVAEKTNSPPVPATVEQAADHRSEENSQAEAFAYDDALEEDPFSAFAGSSFSNALRAISGMVTGMSSRLREILNHLRQKDDPSIQLIALQELSEILLVSNEENLSGHFSPDSFVKELVSLMQVEDNPEIMLLACRSIANLLEALPASVANVVYGGAVTILCQKLLEISFIDLAEQALVTLEKISVEYPASIVREGGLTACLSYLEFFPTPTQRTAVITAANCCRNIPSDSFPAVKEVMPILQNIFSSNDQRVIEQASLCVTGIVESFRNHPDKMEELVTVNLLKIILRLLVPGTNNMISPRIATQFLRLLAFTAHASPLLSAELFKLNVVEILYQILTGVSPPSEDDTVFKLDSVLIMQTLIHRPRDQIIETLNVICELLPQLPSNADPLSHKDFVDLLPDPEPISLQVLLNEGPVNAKRVELLEQCAAETRRFSLILFPTLIDAFVSTINLSVRQKVLIAQIRMLANLQRDVLLDTLASVPYASFLTSILSQADHPSLVMLALQATELLLSRLDDVYRYQLYREGVISEVTKLANAEDPDGRDLQHHESVDDGGRSSGQEEEEDDEDDEDIGSSGDEDAADEENLGGNDNDGEEAENEHDDENYVSDNEQAEEFEHALQAAVRDEVGDLTGNDDENEHENSLPHVDGAGGSPVSSRASTMSLASPPTNFSSNIRSMRTRIREVARRFLEKHETETHDSTARLKANGILSELSSLVHSLEEFYVHGTCSGHNTEHGRTLFRTLASYFSADVLESITSAELLASGLVRVLLDILSHRDEETMRLARSTFLETFMDGHAITKKNMHSTAEGTPFSVMIHKLQDVLSRSEHFEVLTVHHNTFDGNRSSATTMLAKQIRLRLVAQEENDVPKTFRNIMVSIHAIATFKALDDYLRPRISVPHRLRGHRSQAISRALAAITGQTGESLGSAFAARLAEQSLPVIGSTSGQQEPSRQSPSDLFTSRTLRRAKVMSINQPENTVATRNSPHSLARLYRDKAIVRKAARRSTAPGDSPTSLTSRQQLASPSSPPPPPPPPQDNEELAQTLECADEKPLDQQQDVEDRSTPTAQVDNLAETIPNDPLPDLLKVNVEVPASAKKEASKGDGARVSTPSHSRSAPTSRTHTGLDSSSPETLALLSTSSKRSMTYAAAVQSIPQDWHIEFSLDGKIIPNETTIYRAVQSSAAASSHVSKTIWSSIHTIKFKRLPGPPPMEAPLSFASNPEIAIETGNDGIPASLSNHPTTASILRLLNILHELNANIDDVLVGNEEGLRLQMEPLSQFVNPKLTAKLNRQLEEPLIVASNCLPGWSEDLGRLYPFLFPFETRHLFLQSTSFGYARSMSRWQNNQPEENRRERRDERPFLGRLQRQKVRISRSKILESALKVMDLYGASQSILEVEYFSEVGTGLGPTLEFYSTVSREFAKKKLKLWREVDDNENDEFLSGPAGLFPRPLNEDEIVSANGQRILHLFKMLGKFVARSMIDSRIIDLNLNPIFFRINGEDLSSAVKPSLGAVKAVDPGLARSLKAIKKFATAKKEIDGNPGPGPVEKRIAIDNITIDNAKIEELCLDFTLPGYPDIELLPGGSSLRVSIDNVDLYLQRVLDMTLGTGVSRQIDSFRAGFSQVFPYSALRSFTPDELVNLFGRVDEDWSLETLMDSIKADHGYNMDSKAVKHLLQVMSELSPMERRLFLQFATGSPKLPIGGFKSLNPMFTVVLRNKDASIESDAYLPSVMTCANYLKLPDYSSMQALRKQLMTAIREGQGAFHLS